MKLKGAVSAAVFAACAGTGGAAHAAWACNVSGKAACYVKYVEVYTGNSDNTNTYVLAKITADPSSVTACTIIKVKEGSDEATDATVRMTEAMLMTALTTRLPIKFNVTSETNCIADDVIIQKPQ